MTAGQSATGRIHALDALRAFVLLLGIAFHAALSEVFPSTGIWAIGTNDPSIPFWWFIFTSHLFRMEVFFLLAGFFACMVVSKRGVQAFLRDRALRIALVFVLLLYPIKYLDSTIWIAGGLKTGWLQLPPDVVALGPWRIARYALGDEKFPSIHLNHLWFLYFLCIISLLFIALRWLALRLGALATRIASAGDAAVDRLMSGALAPLWLGLPLLPMLAQMDRYDVDTPDKSFLPLGRALALYGYFFLLGWWLHRRSQTLPLLRGRWAQYLVVAVALSVIGWAGEYHLATFGEATNVRAVAIVVNAVTICAAVLGLIGMFLTFFNEPSAITRYLADSAYWTYLVHLPIVVALQVWLSAWDSGVLRFLAVCVLTLMSCLLSYHLLVRRSWLGRWLRGRPLANESAAGAVPTAA